jgi:predicted DNA-binding transcriptional regulator YafY
VNTKRVERLFQLVQTLESGTPHTAEDLSKLLGLSKRTVFRDLALLAQAGVPYRYDHETKRYSADRAALLPPVMLSRAEALALMLATKFLVAQRALPDASAAVSAGQKLESLMPARVREYCGPLARQTRFRIDQVCESGVIAEMLPLLQAAAARQFKVHVRYEAYSDQRRIETKLSPYCVIYIQRGWYVIAHSGFHKDVRTFKLERIQDLRPLDEHFRGDAAFDLDEYLGNAWSLVRGDTRYCVKVRFLRPVAGQVDEVRWHKTQRTAFQDDGSLLFEADVDGLDEVAWWVLGYGDQAIVMAPMELRHRVAECARRMVRYYEG